MIPLLFGCLSVILHLHTMHFRGNSSSQPTLDDICDWQTLALHFIAYSNPPSFSTAKAIEGVSGCLREALCALNVKSNCRRELKLGVGVLGGTLPYRMLIKALCI